MPKAQKQKLIQVGYGRKSQESAERQILSLPAQRTEIEDLASNLGIGLDEIIEEAQSAKMPGRKKFNQMLDDIDRCGAGEIVCWKLDRLARNFIDGGRIIDMLQRNVIRAIYTPGKTYLPIDNVLMMAVEFGMANQFVRDLSVNTKRGLKAKIAIGQPPREAIIGYVNNKITHSWDVDPYYAPIVIQIFEWYDSGLFSELDIVAKLNAAGFVTKKHQKPFHKSMIGRILREPAYYGYFYSKGELYPGQYEPIISKDLWMRVQNRLDGKVTYNHKKTRLIFKYKHILNCPECGCSITAERTFQCICTGCKNKFSMRKKDHCPKCKLKIKDMDNPTITKTDYYRCTKSKGGCSQCYITECKLEPQLLSILEDIKLNQSDIEDIHNELIALYEKDQEFQRVTSKNLRTELTKLEDDKMRIFKKMMLGDVVGDDRDMGIVLKESLTLRINAIKAQIEAMGDSSYSWLEESSNLLKLVNRASELFLAAKPEQKAQLINFVASNLLLDNEKVSFDYKKPFNSLVKMKSHNAERPENNSDRPNWLDIAREIGTFWKENKAHIWLPNIKQGFFGITRPTSKEMAEYR